MTMIEAIDLYNATNGGLQIILYYFPQAAGCVDNNKKFKCRDSEKDASACLKKYGNVYKVTDFGGEGKAMSPIDICMQQENLKYSEAIKILATRYNVAGSNGKTANGPEIKKRPATADEAEGDRFFELEEHFTDEQLKILGPRVKEEHARALNWYIAKSVSFVKNREVVSKYTTPTYPIFIRECNFENEKGEADRFYKIYEPLNVDKQWRFSYTPNGKKPKEYTNGLEELKKAYRAFNDKEEKEFKNDPANADEPYKEKRLDACFICSGERDSLCLRALGYNPVWFNSETYKISDKEMKTLYKYVETVYNIPDIDETGVRKGTELALRFLSVYTIWLPSWLKDFKDWRGNAMKDFRDYCTKKQSNQDFQNLMSLAMPAKFWTETWSNKSKRYNYEINTVFLHHFLNLQGFYVLKDENSDNPKYIHKQGAVVSEVKARDISGFLRRWAEDHFMNTDIRNLISNSPRTSETTLSMLKEVDLDFRNFTPDSQLLFFTGQAWEVTRDGIKTYTDGVPGDRYVMETNVIKHHVKVMPPMFKWEHRKDVLENDVFDIKINEHNSCFFKYLINTSRIYWREELEYYWQDKGDEEAEIYREAHKFDIEGTLLNTEQIYEQKLNLLNKIYSIGYNLHKYKSPSCAWALYAMDNKIGEEDECNGRSGKSFLFKAISQLQRTVNLSGRNPRLMENPHVFDQVNAHTDFVFVDDCDKYLPMGTFYDIITSGMTVNPKNNRSFYIDFDNSPKFGFTTNYVPREFNPSTQARLLYMVFSDYYHEKTEENDYLESRSIRDDFGKNLMTSSDYSEDDWNWDYNFFAQCLQFYLSMKAEGVKIQPPMNNIIKRKKKSDMGEDFEDWAYSYFAEESENLDKALVREKVYEDFILATKVRKEFWKMNRFTKALKSFCDLCEYIKCLNPDEVVNSSGRFQQKVDGQTKDMVYIQSKKNGEINNFAPKIENDGETPF